MQWAGGQQSAPPVSFAGKGFSSPCARSGRQSFDTPKRPPANQHVRKPEQRHLEPCPARRPLRNDLMTRRLDRADTPRPRPLGSSGYREWKPEPEHGANTPAQPILYPITIGFDISQTRPPLRPPAGVEQEIADALSWRFDPPGDHDTQAFRRSLYLDGISQRSQTS